MAAVYVFYIYFHFFDSDDSEIKKVKSHLKDRLLKMVAIYKR